MLEISGTRRKFKVHELLMSSPAISRSQPPLGGVKFGVPNSKDILEIII